MNGVTNDQVEPTRPLRLVRFRYQAEPRLGVVSDGGVRLLSNWTSMLDLADKAINRGATIASLVGDDRLGDVVPRDDVRPNLLLPLAEHELGRCVVSGTGLTHTGSASERDAMHTDDTSQRERTDSYRMFELGRQGGRPAAGEVGAQPEWFFKGDGTILRQCGEAVRSPSFGLDLGDEAEIAGLYVVGRDGQPFRLGFVLGNEFSDHVTERQNYLLLAHSKLRPCALGAEVLVGPLPQDVDGRVVVVRDGADLITVPFRSGERHMCHSVANLEHHHFKYELHRQPGQIHLHFLGADALTLTHGVQLMDGDVVTVTADCFEFELASTIELDHNEVSVVETRVL